jgi:2-iminobutanoate/2-iminopropanoate deaminase
MSRKYLLVFICLFFSHFLLAQTRPLKEKWHYGAVLEDSVWGYAGVVKTGNTLYLSGVTAEGDFATQVTRIYSRLQTVLRRYGATFKNVVKETVYTLSMDSMQTHNKIRLGFYKNDFPAATWVQISRLFLPDRMLEVELTAILPEPEKPSMNRLPDLLKGTWTMKQKEAMVYEVWKKDKNVMKGISYQVKGSDTTWLESIVLNQKPDGTIFYTPTTIGQNNGNPIPFQLVSVAGNMYTFENLKHDFPKRIVYVFESDTELHAWIDGGPEQPMKRADFLFKKQ